MPRREAAVFVLIGFAFFGASSGAAETAAAQPSLYQPKAAAQASPLRVEVIDGVRFRDIQTKAIFRLFGVDACAPGQVAMLGGQSWPCGTMATAWLVKATLGAWVACATIRDEGDEHVARCATANHPDLAAAMLEEGDAVLAPATSGEAPVAAYAAAESQARKAFHGVWSSAFEMPWDWRASHRNGIHSGGQGETVR